MSDAERSAASSSSQLPTVSRPSTADPPLLQDTSRYPSSRTTSRLSQYTDAVTRRSSFASARASLFQDTDTSAAFESANESVGDFDLDSDLEAHSQRAPSRSSTVRSRAASPFQSLARNGSQVADDDALETTIDAPLASPSTITGAAAADGLARRASASRGQSFDRPLSSLSRRSSASSTAHGDSKHRLRDAAAAAANRSSIPVRRHSTDIDTLTTRLSRSSTPQGYRRSDVDEDAAAELQPRPASSLALRQEGGSFIKRDAARDRASILPPAGFFAPKKPSARNSTSDLLATSPQAGRSTTPLSFYSNSGAVDGVADADGTKEEVLRYRSISPEGNEDQPQASQARAPSPWGIVASEHPLATSGYQSINLNGNSDARGFSQIADGSAPLQPLDANDGFPSPSTQPSPHSGLRMMASMDPLLPARAVPNTHTMVDANHSAASNAGLGLDTDAETPASKIPVAEQRVSLPNKAATNSTSKNVTSPPKGSAPTPNATSKPTKLGPRNYRAHKGDNHFLLSGLLMTSGDNPLPFILSFTLLLALGGLFFGFEAPWLTRNISPAIIAIFAYIWLQAVVNMLVTAFRDPGIIPRNLDPDPPCVLGDTPFEPGRHAVADPEDPMAIPVQRVLRIRGTVVKVKWCETCGTYRPPRSSHCRVCDNCVENIDHHCTYLNTCIGRRNYVSFMAFLLASIMSALYVVGCTAARLVLLSRPPTYRYPRGGAAAGLDFRGALSESPVSAVLFLLCIGAVAPLLVLFTYHVRLVLLNRSTVEQIRINTAREYGEHKDLELGTHGDEDAASVFGAADARGGRGKGVVRAVFERFGVMKPKQRDPNPFASKSTRRNVRNALGWRSVQLESWLDRRGRQMEDTRERHPRLKRV